MRTFCVILPFLIASYSYSQISLSAGIARNKDNFFGSNQNFKLSKPSVDNYNAYQLQFDYFKSPFRIYGELGYLTSNFVFEQHTNYSSGGGSSSFHSDSRTYSSHVNFGYLSNKIGLGFIAISKRRNKLWGSFSYNMYMKLERLMISEESDQVMNRTTSTNNNMTQTFVTTVHPPVYYPFNLISFNKYIFQFGTELEWRIGYKNYFIEFSTSLGISSKTRYSNHYYVSYGSNSEQEASLWNFNAGLKLGYLFEKKIAKKTIELPVE